MWFACWPNLSAPGLPLLMSPASASLAIRSFRVLALVLLLHSHNTVSIARCLESYKNPWVHLLVWYTTNPRCFRADEFFKLSSESGIREFFLHPHTPTSISAAFGFMGFVHACFSVPECYSQLKIKMPKVCSLTSKELLELCASK